MCCYNFIINIDGYADDYEAVYTGVVRLVTRRPLWDNEGVRVTGEPTLSGHHKPWLIIMGMNCVIN